MPMQHIKRIAAIAVASLAALSTGAVAAQEYPDRPIRLINPYAPGGSTDPVMRAVTAKLQEILGQPWVMEYKPGAGTNIGSDFVAKSKPDGYTVLLATTAMAMSPSVYKSRLMTRNAISPPSFTWVPSPSAWSSTPPCRSARSRNSWPMRVPTQES